MTLLFLSTDDSIRTVAMLFRVGRTTLRWDFHTSSFHYSPHLLNLLHQSLPSPWQICHWESLFPIEMSFIKPLAPCGAAFMVNIWLWLCLIPLLNGSRLWRSELLFYNSWRLFRFYSCSVRGWHSSQECNRIIRYWTPSSDCQNCAGKAMIFLQCLSSTLERLDFIYGKFGEYAPFPAQLLEPFNCIW